eukprot:3836102-Alexandrium_andersonii.AAC.1
MTSNDPQRQPADRGAWPSSSHEAKARCDSAHPPGLPTGARRAPAALRRHHGAGPGLLRQDMERGLWQLLADAAGARTPRGIGRRLPRRLPHRDRVP